MDDKYRDMISDALSDNDESWDDVIAIDVNPTRAGGHCPDIHVWTARYVYYWDYNDGDERFAPAPRNPPKAPRAPR